MWIALFTRISGIGPTSGTSRRRSIRSFRRTSIESSSRPSRRATACGWRRRSMKPRLICALSCRSKVARFNSVKAAIKLQFRDVDSFVHKDFRNRTDIRYIKKTLDTQLSKDKYRELIEAVKASNCLRMATPFDEASVDLCVELSIEGGSVQQRQGGHKAPVPGCG